MVLNYVAKTDSFVFVPFLLFLHFHKLWVLSFLPPPEVTVVLRIVSPRFWPTVGSQQAVHAQARLLTGAMRRSGAQGRV